MYVLRVPRSHSSFNYVYVHEWLAAVLSGKNNKTEENGLACQQNYPRIYSQELRLRKRKKKKRIAIVIHLIHFLELGSDDAKSLHELVETRFAQIVVSLSSTIAYLCDFVQLRHSFEVNGFFPLELLDGFEIWSLG